MSKSQPEYAICPFIVLIDSREQNPYTFVGLTTNADSGSRPLRVNTQRTALAMGHGDYGIFGFPGVAVERKSKEDLYASIGGKGKVQSKRDNFEHRLRLMSERDCAAVVVEAELGDVISNPPAFTRFRPKALMRTILAWSQRFPRVHWFFLPSRAHAEGFTFRYLERYYLDSITGRERLDIEDDTDGPEVSGLAVGPDGLAVDPEPTEKPWREAARALPAGWHRRWCDRVEELEAAGVMWPEDERRALVEVVAEMAGRWNEGATEPMPPSPADDSAATTNTSNPSGPIQNTLTMKV